MTREVPGAWSWSGPRLWAVERLVEMARLASDDPEPGVRQAGLGAYGFHHAMGGDSDAGQVLARQRPGQEHHPLAFESICAILEPAHEWWRQ